MSASPATPTHTSHEETNPNRERNLGNLCLWLNKISPIESVENLYKAYVNFIDGFADEISDASMYKHCPTRPPKRNIVFRCERVRPKGTLYQFEKVDLDRSFFWTVYLHLERFGQSVFGDERDLIRNSMKSNPMKLYNFARSM
jgi:hypothetical protein